MGANFQTVTMPASLAPVEVKQRFQNHQDDDRFENGNSYSGGFGMATGLSFRKEAFDTEDAAYDWLSEHAEKWGDALCVKVGSGDAAKWMIGANCASLRKNPQKGANDE